MKKIKIDLKEKIASRAVHDSHHSRMEFLHLGKYNSEYGEMTVPVIEVRSCTFDSDSNDEVTSWGETTFLLPNDWDVDVADFEKANEVEWSASGEFEEEITIA